MLSWSWKDKWRRKYVRGYIVSPDLFILNLVIFKKGDHDLHGLTDTEKPRMRGQKRASKIHKKMMFASMLTLSVIPSGQNLESTIRLL